MRKKSLKSQQTQTEKTHFSVTSLFNPTSDFGSKTKVRPVPYAHVFNGDIDYICPCCRKAMRMSLMVNLETYKAKCQVSKRNGV